MYKKNIPKSISLIDTNSDVDKQLSGVIENFNTNENNVLQEDLPLENDLDKEILEDEPEILPKIVS